MRFAPRTGALLFVMAIALGTWLAAGALSAAAPMCMGKRATVVGSSGFDLINGTNGPDVIVGLGQNDTING